MTTSMTGHQRGESHAALLRRVAVLLSVSLLLVSAGAASAGASTDASLDVVRFSTFNASLNRNFAGQLVSDLSTPNNAQAKTIAEIVQRARPDVLLINEFDYVENGLAAELFQDNYLSVSQNGADSYRVRPLLRCALEHRDPVRLRLQQQRRRSAAPDDAFGFGFFPGQFGMAVYSRYPIDDESIRTFQHFLWKDMPGALLPDDPNTTAPADWYSAAELDVFRLSSKSHWDVPIEIGGREVHFLVSHPTPPVFDGPEDRTDAQLRRDSLLGRLHPALPERLHLRRSGHFRGTEAGAPFVIAGDQNSDPLDGDSIPGSIQQLLDHPLVNTKVTPSSEGAPQQAALQGGANTTHGVTQPSTRRTSPIPLRATSERTTCFPGRRYRSRTGLCSGR